MAQYFSLILVAITLITGLLWLLDLALLKPKRQQKLALAQSGGTTLGEEATQKIMSEPAIIDTAKQIFPIIAFVLVMRSFFYEPFQIPSGSMKPTLLVGDFILVEKFAYGVKDPVFRSKFIETGEPKRGDVAVFKYPENPTLDYIKRVVGLPGDTVRYRNKQLWIKPACEQGNECQGFTQVALDKVNVGEFDQFGMPQTRYTEQLPGQSHDVLVTHQLPSNSHQYYWQRATAIDEFVVPEGEYFVLGDNRDNSRDSRYWGFVKDEHLVGKAVFIWISFEFERDSQSWLPGWIPSDVRFNRIGGIS
ncbi:signal peptidase I [Paraferrimonas sp. SM1919]|uniref:signal peptidase I n=1 Tax=Paraferrimonas sp. SM1919 TaxID=2662263 RepID=UPI00196A167D|nr:signal peptidase I [Paraferrimonas sp. SM1919]